VQPIFVLGLNRNGTTWLQNVLCNHPQVIGAQDRAHWGAKENNMMGHIKHWGDFSNNDEFIKFLELYSSGDYFKLVDGNKEYFYKNRPTNFIEFFLELMDNYARKKDVKYWTTKLSPKLYENNNFINEIDQRYDEVKFIGIKREYGSVLTSFLNMQGERHGKKLRKNTGMRELFALYHILDYTDGYNSIEEIISHENGLMLKFDLLKNHRKKAMKKLVKYINIEYTEKMLEDQYPPNSSYAGREEKISLSNWEKKVINQYLRSIFQNENKFTRLIWGIKDYFKNRLTSNECPIFWRLLKLEKMEEAYKDELEEKGRVGLKKMLFEDD